MSLKEKNSFSPDENFPEKGFFLSEEASEEAYRKKIDSSFRCTGLVFLLSFFLAGVFVSLGAAERNNDPSFSRDLFAGIIFFLPVIITGLYTRGFFTPGNMTPVFRRKLLPLYPEPLPEKKKLFLLSAAAFAGGIALQIPVLLLGALQKSIFLKLGISVLAQEKVSMISTILSGSGDKFFPLVCMLFPPLFLAPFAEELFFRLILFDKIREYTTKEYAIWVTTVIFALFHGNVAAFLPLVLVGFVCQKVCIKTSSLLPAVLLHTGFNFSTFLLLFAANAV